MEGHLQSLDGEWKASRTWRVATPALVAAQRGDPAPDTQGAPRGTAEDGETGQTPTGPRAPRRGRGGMPDAAETSCEGWGLSSGVGGPAVITFKGTNATGTTSVSYLCTKR